MINLHIYPSDFTNESRILREVRSLNRLGYFRQIHLVGVTAPGLCSQETVESGVSIYRFGVSATVAGSLVEKVLRGLRWGVQVFHEYRQQQVVCINCHSVAALPLCVGLKWATGSKLIYDAHELESEANGLSGFRKRVTKIVERALIRYVDHSIFVGVEIERWYRREYRLTNTSVLYNCPAIRNVERSEYFRDRFLIEKDQLIFLYQGVLASGRGVELLIDAFSSVSSEAALVLMGYGPLAGWVQDRVMGSKNVFFHAAVPPDELLQYTAAADFGLSLIEPTSLSYEYCMPNKLFEYLMVEKPVIVSPTLEQRNFVEAHGIGIVADDLTPAAIRRAVHEALSCSRAEMQAAIVRARLKFNWEAQEPVLKGIFDGLGFSARENGRPENMVPERIGG